MSKQQPDSMQPTYLQMRYDLDSLMYEHRPRWRRLRRVSLPVVYENLLALLLTWSDVLLTGYLFTEPRYLACLAIGTQIYLMITALAGMISVRAAGMVSRRAGARQLGKTSEVLAQALLLSLLAGALLTVGILATGQSLVRWGGLSPAAWSLGELYLDILALGVPAILVQHACCACLRSFGLTGVALAVTATHFGVAVVTSWLLALSTPLGFFAIPVGTTLGSLCGGGLALIWLLRGAGGPDGLRLPTEVPWPDTRRFKQILKSGIPGGSIWVLINLGALVHLALVGRLGDSALAALGVVLRCESLAWVAGRALASTASSLTGQSLGADRPDLARGYAWRSALCGIVSMTAIAVVVALAGPWLVPALLGTTSDEVVASAVRLLPWSIFGMPGLALLLILTSAMVSGASDTRWPLLYTLIGAVIVRVGLALVLIGPLQMGLIGAWLAILADYWFRGLCASLRFSFGNWQAQSY